MYRLVVPSPAEPLIRTLLGLPPQTELSVQWEPGANPGRLGRLAVDVPAADLSLEILDGAESGHPPWIQQGELELRIAPPPRPSPEQGVLAKRMGAAFTRRAEASAPGLRAALGVAAVRTFASLAKHHAREGYDIWHHADGAAERRGGTLRLGFRCNQDCWFCWQGRDWPDAPGDPRARIDALAEQGVTTLSITGGEPTAYKALPSLIAHARAAGMQVSIQTNAIALSRPRLLARLLDAGLQVAFVSFHSADPEVSDAMTRAPGTWQQTVAGVRAALSAGLAVRLNCVVERANVGGLAEHARFVVQRFLPGSQGSLWGVSYSHPSRYFDDGTYGEHVAPLDEVAAPLREAAAVLRAAGLPVELQGSCGFPLCVIDDVVGLEPGLGAMAYPAVQTASRTAAAACSDCSAASRCIGPRSEYLAVHGERGLSPR